MVWHATKLPTVQSLPIHAKIIAQKCTFEEGVRAAQNATTTKQLSGAFEGGGGGGGGTVVAAFVARRRAVVIEAMM